MKSFQFTVYYSSQNNTPRCVCVCVLNLTFVPCQTGVDRELDTLPPAVVLPYRSQPQALLHQVVHS